MQRKLRIIFYDVVNKKRKTIKLNYNDLEKMNLFDLKCLVYDKKVINPTESGLITFNNYYMDFDEKMFYREKLPYIISNNEILFNVYYENCKILDFCTTHNVKNKIKVEYGYPACGGFGEITNYWDTFLNFISFCSSVYGTLEFSKFLYSSLKNKYIKNDINPMTYIDLIFSRDNWNLNRLSQLLKLKIEETEELLIFCGYTRHVNEYTISHKKRKKKMKEFEQYKTYTKQIEE